MSSGQRAALEMAESAREEMKDTGLATGLFFGTPDFHKLLPYNRQRVEDLDQGDAFLSRLREVLNKYADPDAIDREGEIPDELLGELAQLGAFGIKIPVAYGGL